MEKLIIKIYPELYFKGYDKKSNILVTEDINDAKQYIVEDFDTDDDDESDPDKLLLKLNKDLFIDNSCLKYFNHKTEIMAYE